MSPSAVQYQDFFDDVIKSRIVWAIKDEDGFPAPENAEGRRAMPFWSTLNRVNGIIAKVPAYRGFQPYEITLDMFIEKWLPGLRKDRLLVGVNWTGPNATGYNEAPDKVLKTIKMIIRDL